MQPGQFCDSCGKKIEKTCRQCAVANRFGARFCANCGAPFEATDKRPPADGAPDTSGAQQIPSDKPGMRRFEHPLSLVPRFTGLRFYTFPGGCITYRFSFAPGASPVPAGATDSALSSQPRSVLVDFVRHTEGLALCGRGAACPR